MTVTIIGAGMAGLLSANMLAHRRPEVIEAQNELPNNHSAVLRFRSSVVGDTLNIPFQKVTMQKDVLRWRNPVADALAYSFKNSGVYRSDRSIMEGAKVGERWIAPTNLIEQMAERVNGALKLNTAFVATNVLGASQDADDRPIYISTMPMPTLMKMLDYRYPVPFNANPGLNIRAHVNNCDAYVSLLIPDPEKPFSRISLAGDEIIIEVPRFSNKGLESEAGGELLKEIGTTNLRNAARILGVEDDVDFTTMTCTPQRYAKILPVEDRVRKEFMHWATDKYNIFSLGRFATWRPGLLLDDLVNDIRLIDRWIGDRYSIARHR